MFMRMQDAGSLAMKIVANYGLSDIGITTYAGPTASLGYMQKSFEARALALSTCNVCLLCSISPS